MMWNASVNAICARAHGTGFTASTRQRRGEHRGLHHSRIRSRVVGSKTSAWWHELTRRWAMAEVAVLAYVRSGEMPACPYIESETSHGEGHPTAARRRPRGQRCWPTRCSTRAPRSPIEERDALGLHGLLPTHVETIEERADRVRAQLALLETDLERHVLLRGVQDYDETLFLRVILDDIVDADADRVHAGRRRGVPEVQPDLPCTTAGLFLSYPDADRMEEMLRVIPHDEVAVIVVTDGERILGLGDQGADGLGIPIGKLSLYSACGGIDPATTLPIVLDVGTNNEERRNDPDYLGLAPRAGRRARLRRLRRDVRHGRDEGVPGRDAPVGGLRRAPRPPAARPLPRPALHVQRRHPGHGHGRPGRGPVGAAAVRAASSSTRRS